MTLLARITDGISFGVQMLGLLVMGLIFIIAPGLAMSLGMGLFRFKAALE